MREPAPDGKALRALRAWVEGQRDAASSDYKAADSADKRASCNVEMHVYQRVMGQIDRLTSAPVADAEVEDDYKSLDHAMEILRSCVSPYTGEQAQKVAKALKQWQEKWKAAVDLIFPDERQTLAGLRAMLADAESDRLAIAQQVGIVYVADHHAPVAGPTPAILRAIAKMQRDAGDADQLRSAGLSLRAENERLRSEDAQWPEQIAAALNSTADRIGRTPSMVAGHVRLEHEAHSRKDAMFGKACDERDTLRAENARLQTDLAAARADQAAMARRELEAVQSWMFQFRPAGYPNTVAVASFCTDRLAALPQPKPAAEPSSNLDALLAAAKNRPPMTDEEREAQRQSWVRGEAALARGEAAEGDDVLRDAMKRAEGELHVVPDSFGEITDQMLTVRDVLRELCRRALAGKEKP
jgi:hypothetical protein